ncbi:MAG: GNAT family N-acetyltransferase [Elusimicrobia bacterium]|nr:GNAT family N-acetyltransferase [Elusimicrobiota bacterium]
MAAIRAAVLADLPAVTEIYNQAVLRATGTFDTEPKTLEQQKEWFARHGSSHPVIVAEENGAVVGWACVSQYSDRCAYAKTAEVSVYIDEKARGRGIGGELLDGILDAAKKAGLAQILARITEGNDVSLRLHAKRGFFEAGRLKKVGEKFGKILDVHILQKSLALLLLFLGAPALADVNEDIRESVVLLTAGDVAGARAKADAAVAAAPNNPKAQEQLGNAALAGLDWKTAEAAAERALAAGETPARRLLRANARLAGGDYAGARADAERAATLSPSSGRARVVLALALEASGRSAAEVLKEYRRAVELDAAQGGELEAAERRLRPRPAPAPAGEKLGPIIVILAISALFGWIWGKASRAGEENDEDSPIARPLLPGNGRLSPRQALAAADTALKEGSPDPRALAEALYARLTGRPAFPRDTDRALGRYIPATSAAKGLPAGIDTFFARALDPEPSRRFATSAELVGALRSLVNPPIQ